MLVNIISCIAHFTHLYCATCKKKRNCLFLLYEKKGYILLRFRRVDHESESIFRDLSWKYSKEEDFRRRFLHTFRFIWLVSKIHRKIELITTKKWHKKIMFFNTFRRFRKFLLLFLDNDNFCCLMKVSKKFQKEG